MARTNLPEKPQTGMTYRGADGRPHIVAEQEQAARDAQQSGAEPKPDPAILGRRVPD